MACLPFSPEERERRERCAIYNLNGLNIFQLYKSDTECFCKYSALWQQWLQSLAMWYHGLNTHLIYKISNSNLILILIYPRSCFISNVLKPEFLLSLRFLMLQFCLNMQLKQRAEIIIILDKKKDFKLKSLVKISIKYLKMNLLVFPRVVSITSKI